MCLLHAQSFWVSSALPAHASNPTTDPAVSRKPINTQHTQHRLGQVHLSSGTELTSKCGSPLAAPGHNIALVAGGAEELGKTPRHHPFTTAEPARQTLIGAVRDSSNRLRTNTSAGSR